MRYKVLKSVESDEKADEIINVSAQCMLKLLMNRLFAEDNPSYVVDDNADIDYDFSMYGDELKQMKKEMGYSNDKYIDSAESFVRKL